MSDYFVSFATTGNPNSAPSGKLPVWPVYNATTDAYLELGPQIAARSELRRAAYDSLDARARGRGELRPQR